MLARMAKIIEVRYLGRGLDRWSGVAFNQYRRLMLKRLSGFDQLVSSVMAGGVYSIALALRQHLVIYFSP
jgi:hypothetical protein